jgi:hypothetical protein
MDLAERQGRALLAAVKDKGFTPRRKDVEALVGLLDTDDDDAVDDVLRAVLAHPDEALDRALERFAGSRPPLRGRLVKLVGRLLPVPALAARVEATWHWVVGRLEDDDAKTRRNAILVLGRATADVAEDALLASWDREERVDHKVSVAQSLGRVGGVKTRALMQRVASGDPRLQKAIDQASLMVERTMHRDAGSAVEARGVPRAAAAVELTCKRGLESMLAAEFDAAWGPTVVGPGRVRVMLSGSLETIFRARIFQSMAFAIPPVMKSANGDVADAVVAAVLSPGSLRILESFTLRTIRYRLEWAEGGHRRALTWQVVSRIAALCPALVNDPKDSTWEIIVREMPDRVQVLLRPRKLNDPRFGYRRAEVAAASHPTVAAALARVAGVSADDVIWDPFVGSALELVERGRLGPYARMEGRDLEAAALDAARANLTGFTRVSLVQGDALDPAPAGVSLIITNPPMGHRVGFGQDVGAMLERFVAHAARALVPGGRMVWLSPLDPRVRQAGTRAGLRLAQWQRVDLGGLVVELQRLERPA